MSSSSSARAESASAPKKSADQAAHSAAGQLTIDEIVAAALRVALDKGFESLTMRALADELGVSAMATYYHIPNKRALLELVIDSILASVEVPADEFGTWDERLQELNYRSTEALGAWPELEKVLYSLPPTAEGWRLMNGYFEILLDAGFTRRNAVLAFSVIHSYGMGRSGMELRLRGGVGADQAGKRQEWPALREVEGLWRELHRPDYRNFAWEVILDGLRVMLDEQNSRR